MDYKVNIITPENFRGLERGFNRVNISTNGVMALPSKQNNSMYAIWDKAYNIGNLTGSRNTIPVGNVAYLDLLGATLKQGEIEMIGGKINPAFINKIDGIKLINIILDASNDLTISGQMMFPIGWIDKMRKGF